MATLETPAPAQGRSASLGMSPVVVISTAFLFFMVCVAVFAEWLAPAHFTTQNLAARLRPPMTVQGDFTYYLGTDQLGRDILSRVIYGARTSLLTAVGAVAIAAAIGVPMGLIAGYFGGWRDAILMRIVDVLLALPGILFAMALIAGAPGVSGAAVSGPAAVQGAAGDAANIAVVQSLYAAFAAGDGATIGAVLSPELVWIEAEAGPTPTSIPTWDRRRCSRACSAASARPSPVSW